MGTYIAGFLLMLVVAAIMSLGLIFGGKRLRGSCGGSQCSNCSNFDKCARKADTKEDV